jgi:transposase
MQVQNVSKQRTNVQSTAGIDVSQEWLDVHIVPGGKSLRVPNTPVGIGKLKRTFRIENVGLVTIEPTGRWHRLVQRSLHASGLSVALVNPYQVRSFARACLQFAKNDRLDAKVLAVFGATLDPVARPPAPEIMEELGELVQGRASAIDERTALQNQHHAATIKFLKAQLKRRIARLEEAIGALDREIERIIKSVPSLARRFEILTSIPGIGKATATTFIAGLRELGAITSKAVARLVGLAPLDWESGKQQGRRMIFGGRADVRRMAYMAAVSACLHNPPLKVFHDRLRNAGKAYKQTAVAVARKLVILANTLIAEDRLWLPKSPKPA